MENLLSKDLEYLTPLESEIYKVPKGELGVKWLILINTYPSDVSKIVNVCYFNY